MGSAISRCVRLFRSNNFFTSTIDIFKIPVGHGNNNYTIPVSCGHGDNSNDDFFSGAAQLDYHGHGNINDNNIYPIPVPCRHGNINIPGLKPFHKANYIPLTSTFASVGSSLFSVGGQDNSTRWPVSKIYQLDRACAPVWDDDFAVTMLCPRVGHHVVGMDGKLYTMGGLIDENYSQWGECFDPSSNKLSRLPSPPFDQLLKWGGDSIVVAPLHSSKKILVAPRFPSSSDVAFFYRVEDEAWEELDHMVDFSTIQGEAAVLRNSTTLCWFLSNTMEIHAYDLVLRKWFKSPVEGLDKVGIVGDKGKCFCSFRLDDNHICLLWQDSLGLPINRAFGLLHYAEVEVKISECSPGEFILKAFVVFSQSYVLEPGARLFKGLAFDIGEGDDGQTEAVHGRTGVGSSGGGGPDGRNYQAKTYW